MSIRTYLILSYLALVLLLISGAYALAEWSLNRLTTESITLADDGIIKASVANYEAYKKAITDNMEKIIEATATEVADQLSYILKGQKPYNYVKLRKDENIREVATQDISIDDVVVGYISVYDNKGEVIWHPNKQLEGKNYSEWKQTFPGMYKCISRSLKKKKLINYCNFLDRNDKKREKFIALVRVPKTTFTVVAEVNVDKFILPAYKELSKISEEITGKSKQSVEHSFKTVSWQIKVGGLIGGVVFCLIGGLSGLWFTTTLSRPLLRLRDGVSQVGEGNFSVVIPETGPKEIVQVSKSFNALGQQLTDYIDKRDFIRDTFGRYVTQEVVKKLLESKDALEMGGETREVSIIMSDLRGFTALTADMEPNQLIAFLNRYLGKMIDILLDHKAVIDEIIGDGILAFFGAPEPMEDHPIRAVACALKMQAAMDEINLLNRADGFPHLEMSVVVNTGDVVVGNIGSEKRTKYGLVGSQVNLTGRMESYALGGQVLVSPYAFSRVRENVDVRNILHVEMKGIPETIDLYDVRGIRGPYQIQLKERYEKPVPLPERINIHLWRLRGKIIVGTMETAWITHLCETSAIVILQGELVEWEDVRIYLLNEKMEETPGKAYGKVISMKRLENNLNEADIRLTSTTQEIYQIIQQVIGAQNQAS
jgi:class 3 adenylate cyclase/HAMP domain-containing protein